jgi:hypothetical protein
MPPVEAVSRDARSSASIVLDMSVQMEDDPDYLDDESLFSTKNLALVFIPSST